ncbi:MAG: hypothetical protein AB7Q29_14095 [Vicinamibacterales bacterium]
MKIARFLVAILLALGAAACGSVSDPSNYVTENFSDTLQPDGERSQGFTVGRAGEMQITLTSLSPVPRLGFLTIAVGLYSGTDCLALPGFVILSAALNQQYSFPRVNPASYCIVITDINNVLTEPTAFSLRYLHP